MRYVTLENLLRIVPTFGEQWHGVPDKLHAPSQQLYESSVKVAHPNGDSGDGHTSYTCIDHTSEKGRGSETCQTQRRRVSKSWPFDSYSRIWRGCCSCGWSLHERASYTRMNNFTTCPRVPGGVRCMYVLRGGCRRVLTGILGHHHSNRFGVGAVRLHTT